MFVMSMRRGAAIYVMVVLAAALMLLCPQKGIAQQVYKEDFTGIATSHNWYFFNGACLTAGTVTASNPGTGNGCTAIKSTYYSGEPLVGGANGISGPTQTLPDPTGSGALRLTNGCTKEGGNACTNQNQVTGAATNTHTYGGGHHQNGAIISADTFNASAGISVTFKTVTYRGDSGGGDGADGISFFLMDGATNLTTYADNFGAFGGSLGYTCTNSVGNYDSTKRSDGTVRGFDGMVGAYIGLGIDEYGNFLNGAKNTLGETDSTASAGDNTASGGFFKSGRIGLRGRGNISYKWLNANYPLLYPSWLYNSSDPIFTTLAAAAVHNTCVTGYLWNSALAVPLPTTIPVDDYAAIPGAYRVLSGVTIANESAVKRGSTNIANTDTTAAYPITYNLKITTNNLLSLSYSYNGGTYQPVITNQSISNGTQPGSFRFGFAGSTGGASNIHEILCFKAAPSETSNSSGGVNVYQNPTIKTGTQLYLAYYFPNDWTGQLTATNLLFDTSQNTVVVANTPSWDARCVLTGVNTTTGPCSTGVTSQTAQAPSSRVMLTWNGTAGVAFNWSYISTNSSMKSTIDSGDLLQNGNRVAFIRGDRTNELSTTGTCPQLILLQPCFRSRNAVLGDIVDSSPTFVGPPGTYSTNPAPSWRDALWTSASAPEQNTSYADFATNNQSRANVVYVGANDGFLHGFRAGAQDASGNLVTTSTPNDGYEVIAYMPGTVFQNIHNSTVDYDYANQQYSHAWFVDATPGTGDLFYSGAWHTWVVGGLGPGGAAIYALDVTDPSRFAEGNASSLVMGEWTSSNLTCINVSNCNRNLGNTYGTPLIRRFHNGQWGVIWGNGYGASSTSAAGIFILLINPSTAAKTIYYLATPTLNGGNTANGIASIDSADLDLDHIVDYIYAGDLQGHVWRFDVAQQDPSKWAVSTNSPLFTTPGGAPITAGLTVSTLKAITMTNLGGQVLDNSKPERVMVNFGTGQQTPQTLTTATSYATAQQYIFGIWDWDFNASSGAAQPGWNSLSQVKAIAATAPQTISMSKLTQQTITTVTQASPNVSYRTVTNNAVCWLVPSTLDGSSSCPTYPTAGTQFGWYIALPGTMEQVIFNPILTPDGELAVNTFIPSQDSPLSCNTTTAGTGFTMGVSPGTGGGQQSGTSSNASGYFQVNTNSGVLGADGIQLNGTGIPFFIQSGQKGDSNSEYMITQTSSGAADPTTINRHSIVTGKRMSWIQRR